MRITLQQILFAWLLVCPFVLATGQQPPLVANSGTFSNEKVSPWRFSYYFPRDTINGSKNSSELKSRIQYIIQDQPDSTIKEEVPQDPGSINYFQPYQGLTINRIKIKQQEVFGQSVADTAMMPDTWFKKLGNGLHVSTQKRIIENRIFIEPGDPVVPLIIADNERLIRNMPNIEDVRIYAEPDSEHPDTLNLKVVTKDVWPVGFSLDIFDVKYGRLGMWNKNLIGLGHEFYYWLTWDYNRSPYYGHKFRYRVHNIANTFITSDAWYENTWNLESYKLYLNRDFFTPQTKFAGGFGFEKILNTRDIELPDSLLLNQYISYNHYDAWLGRAFILNLKSGDYVRRSIAFTGRVSKYHFYHSPDVSDDFLYDYTERTVILGSVGFSTQGFARTHHVYGFGKSEDISFGSLISLTAGVDINEFDTRPYAGFSYSKGIELQGYSLLYLNCELGGFLTSNIEQGQVSFLTRYFTPLLNAKNRYNYRIFALVDYKFGYHRFADEFMSLKKNDGIRGLESTLFKGDQRVKFNFETVCYSPHNILGFRFNYFLFADAGIISYKTDVLFRNPIYSGIGAGVRIKNEHLAFNTLQIRLGYYPNLPEEATAEYIGVSGNGDQRPDNYSLTKPSVLIYQNR